MRHAVLGMMMCAAACGGEPVYQPDAGCDMAGPPVCVDEDFTAIFDDPRAELPYGEFALITGSDRLTRENALGVAGGASQDIDRGEEIRVSFAHHADEIAIEWMPSDEVIEVRYGDGAVAESLLFDASPALIPRARWIGISTVSQPVAVTGVSFCAQ